MQPSHSVSVMSAVLVIGEPSTAQARATELRLMGYPTWTATSAPELRWLLDQAWIRPAFAVVDTRTDADDRGGSLLALAQLAASANLPALLIGADPREARLFSDVFATLPGDVDVHTVIDRLQGGSA